MNKSETLLITGGAGYIGANVLFYLIEKNINFIVCDNFSNSTNFSIKQLEKYFNKNIKLYNINMCNKSELEKVFSENHITSVLHLAGKKYIPESFKMPETYYKNNVEATKTLLEVMSMFNVKKLYFASSIAVYGNSKDLPFTTTTPLSPNTPYGENKRDCEILIANWQQQNNNRHATILRFTNPIGCRVSPYLGDLSTNEHINLVPYLVKNVVENKEIAINGNTHKTADGTTERDYIDVKDLAFAVTELINVKKQPGLHTYIIGSGRTYSVLEILHTIFNIYSKPIKYHVNPKRIGDVPIISVDISKIKQEINFLPKQDLKEIISLHVKYKNYIKDNPKFNIFKLEN